MQKDLLSHVSHPKEMRRGNVLDATAAIVTIIHGRTIRGVPQLNGEGMHNACFDLREIVRADVGRIGARAR
jgi:hypothetical protein